jgi:hypothetical protein
MAKPRRRFLRIALTLLLLLVVVGLVGHFSADLSGRDPRAACGLHTGLILLTLTAIVGVLMLVNTLFADDPIDGSCLFPPHIRPPNYLP